VLRRMPENTGLGVPRPVAPANTKPSHRPRLF